MRRILLIWLFSAGLTATALLPIRLAWAALGEPAAPVAPHGTSHSGVRSAATVSGNYEVRETVSDANSVREYIAPSGVVFGVAWNGMVTPDLEALLGPYAEEYRKARSEAPRQPGKRRVQVKTNRVVVERWGHMRNLQGRAYAPELVPQGVGIDEIK